VVLAPFTNRGVAEKSTRSLSSLCLSSPRWLKHGVEAGLRYAEELPLLHTLCA